MTRELTRGGWALRTVIGLGPPLALLAATPEGFVPPLWLGVLVVLVSGAFAYLPEQYVGTAALLLVVGWWAVDVRDAMPLAVVVASGALLASHLAATLAAYGPRALSPDRAIVLRWARRGVLAWLVAPVLWLVIDSQRGRTTPASYWVAGLAVALVVAVVAASVYPTRLDQGM
jgi:cytochrome bd-type quinol oxidase subunit 2